MSSTTLEPIRVQARSLGKAYGPKIVLHDITVTFEPGTVTAFLGRNGAGKSTAVRRIAGLTSGGGTVTFAGRALLEHEHPHRVLGVDLGTPQAHPGRKVADHLRLLARHVADGRRRVDEVVDLLGIEHLMSMTPRRFSTGMKRSVALAGTLLADPSVLILDEPINGLEVAAVQRVKNLLRSHADRGGTVLVASHILAEVERFADRVLVLAGGRIIANEPLDQYLRRNQGIEVEVKVDAPAQLLEVARELGWVVREERPGVIVVSGQDTRVIARVTREMGVLVFGLSERRATLEDVFLRSTETTAPVLSGVTQDLR